MDYWAITFLANVKTNTNAARVDIEIPIKIVALILWQAHREAAVNMSTLHSRY
jgi:hypothetical protein